MKNIRFNEETTKNINNAYSNYRIDNGVTNTRKLRMSGDNLGGAGVYAGNWHIADLVELQETIDELVAMKEAIKEVTGIMF